MVLKMKKQTTLIIILIMLLLNAACISRIKRRQMFRDAMNFNISRLFFEVPVPEPSKITPIGNGKSEYLIEYKNTGCKFVYVVDDSTLIIEKWRYVSDPCKCYHETGWFQPW